MELFVLRLLNKLPPGPYKINMDQNKHTNRVVLDETDETNADKGKFVLFFEGPFGDTQKPRYYESIFEGEMEGEELAKELKCEFAMLC